MRCTMAGRPRRREQAREQQRLELRESRLGGRGHLGQLFGAPLARDRKRPEPALAHLRRGQCHREKHQLDAARHQVLQRGRASLVGHVHDADAGRARHQLAREMPGGADTRRAVVDLARPGTRQHYQLGDTRRGERRMRYQRHREIGELRHRHEILVQVVGQRAVEEFVGGERLARHEERVAVG